MLDGLKATESEFFSEAALVSLVSALYHRHSLMHSSLASDSM